MNVISVNDECRNEARDTIKDKENEAMDKICNRYRVFSSIQ